jgi:hypothetical protein
MEAASAGRGEQGSQGGGMELDSEVQEKQNLGVHNS